MAESAIEAAAFGCWLHIEKTHLFPLRRLALKDGLPVWC